ncbi:hypothetical protein FUAX_09830 [Fulvitalea axinellae]|uniref:Uncharacterized protein n=1 Tax=Fulvitalea axinellae TaxID=1182444 RepID=A0AAU9CI56_9BACT|nr:hypothetical protein FUAX_09830 [Fulvitalea axinellae]
MKVTQKIFDLFGFGSTAYVVPGFVRSLFTSEGFASGLATYSAVLSAIWLTLRVYEAVENRIKKRKEP